MQIEENKSLKNLNTFGIECIARQYVSVGTVDELKSVLAHNNPEEIFVLGGGSNMLLRQPLEKLVVHINIKGITVVQETEATIHIKAMAGENWNDFVQYCIDRDFGGLENLSLIPGNVGTAPIQNIGAYGVELKDTFVSCTAVSVADQKEVTFDLNTCRFGYRTSIFKEEEKGKFIITSVTFKLTKKNHSKNISYGDILKILEEENITNPSPRDISNAVIAIRQSKLPDPKVLGNSGSFFKNPVVDYDQFKIFQQKFPEAPFYEISPTTYKIPAGWLIEKAGYKGKRFGDAGVHKKQALVLVNYGSATGEDIWNLAMKIQEDVKQLTGITIEPEVNVF